MSKNRKMNRDRIDYTVRIFPGILFILLSLFFLSGEPPITEALADSLPVESETTLWTDGNTYVVEDEVVINEKIEVQGTVILYLGKDGILTASKGIYVPENSGLTIEGTGELVAFGDDTLDPGIGAKENAGTIIINGGIITANGGYTAAPGIGAGTTSFGSITINGGTVNAIGGLFSAGIGGGSGTKGCITINGGMVTATGGDRGTGIGSDSSYLTDLNITITGGTVTATGTEHKAGIGGRGMIMITGGKVTAINESGGFGIGASYKSDKNMTSIVLGWTNPDDFIQSTSYCGQVRFVQDQSFFLDGTNTVATLENIENQRIVPCMEELFSITVDTADHGSVYADHYLAPAGANITLTSVPKKHYETSDITVTWPSGSIVPKQTDYNVWCFTMPEHNVVTTAIFDEEHPVSLITSEGTKDCVRVWNDTMEFDSQTSEWFAVMEDTTITQRVKITGDVKLYLHGGRTLTCKEGINVSEGNSLTIEGDGTLIANTNTYKSNHSAAIGGNDFENSGCVLIRGGIINATGGQYAAGIGSGGRGSCGTITISGGEVYATGGKYGAGIGGGDNGSGGNITINGGKVYVTGGRYGAGIGSGDNGSGGNITISGGKVYATGGEYSAGIGCGANSSGGNITISGGKVYATSGTYSVGIGCAHITISGGEIYATGGEYGAAIQGLSDDSRGDITINGGRIAASNEYDPELGIGRDEDDIILGWTNPEDYIESCGYKGTIRFAEGKTFLRSGTLQAVETVEQMAGIRIIPQAGKRYNINISCTGDGSFGADTRTGVEGQRVDLTWTTSERYVILKSLTVKDSEGHDIDVTRTGREDAFFTMPADDVAVSAEIGRVLPVRITTSAGEKDCVPISSMLNYTDYSSGWYAVTEDTTIPARMMITGDVKLYLCEGTTLTCIGGINVDGDNSLTIEGKGTLIANASWYSGVAGIGGNYSNGGNIKIRDGNIEVIGGYLAAGIGGGYHGSAGRITIDGGTVTTTGGDYGAGIGSGSDGSGGSISISGGTVRAYGGFYADGIGGGSLGQGGDVTLGLSAPNDSIYSSSYGGNVIFETNTYLILRDTGEFATEDNIDGKVLVPCNEEIIYSVAIDKNPNASVDSVRLETRKNADILNRAIEGSMIHVECTTGYPYNITGLAVTGEQGENIAVTKLDDDMLHTEFSFEMPAGNVTLHLETIEIQYHKISLDVEEGRDIIGVADNIQGRYKLNEAYQGLRLYVSCGSAYETVVTGLTVTTEHGQSVPVTPIDQLSYSFVMPGDNVTIRPEVTERATVVRDTTKGQKQCINIDEHINVWCEDGADGWYTLTRDVTINYQVYVRDGGNIGLYLGEGTTLRCRGIYVSEGCNFTIEGPGTLIADAIGRTMSTDEIINKEFKGCGIGGRGSIIINSGNIIAYGGEFGAGIGGTNLTSGSGLESTPCTITIRGGNVTAYGGAEASGIGGAYRQDYGTITITGGTVHAYGGPSGAGIGGGAYSPGKVVISGGNVTAVGGWSGSGIGGGNGGTGNVTISGGTVSASGGGSARTADMCSNFGAGIGDGALAYGQGGIVRITGGKITAKGGTRYIYTSSGIGSGGNSKLTDPGTIILGWTDPDDYIYASAYGGNVSFVDGKLFMIDGQNTLASADNIGGVRIAPVSEVYTVTVDGNTENGSITADQSVMFAGGRVTLTVTPDAGYETESVTVMQGMTPVDVTDNQFIMPAGDVCVTAAFSRKKYSIITIAENGTAIADKQAAYSGETVTLTLSPADNRYSLASLEVLRDNQLIETTNTGDETCAFIMPEGEVTVKAAFFRQYFICFVNRDGTVLQWFDMGAGQTPAYTGETPQFEANAEHSFTFDCWIPEIAPVSGDMIYTASYSENRRSYPVRFVNWDGYELQSDELFYGETPVYTEEEPRRIADESYKYEFSGWTPAIAEVTGETTYTATFRAVPILRTGINMVQLKENEPVYCPFTPIEDGYYHFWSTAEGDILPILHIYDRNGDPVETEYYTGQNFNIDCLAELKGGKTYSVKLESFRGEIDLPIQVEMVKMHNVSIGRGIAHGNVSCSTIAFTGQMVSFDCTPEEGYMPDVLVIEGADGSRMEISVFEGDRFIMPDTDVTLFGCFSPVYAIMVSENEKFRISMIYAEEMSWGGDGMVHVKPGQTVEMAWPDAEEGYEIDDTLAITTDTGRTVPYRIIRDQWNQRVIRFLMPDTPVTVNFTIRELAFGNPDFTLPASITRVEEEAFEGAAVTVVYIPDTCCSIGAHAFRNCKELTKIRVPEQCSIGEDAFEECDWVYVFGTSGSDADIYCQTHDNCQFVEE